MAEKKSGFTTVYEQQDAGTVAFQGREELIPVIEGHLDAVRQLLDDYRDEPAVRDGLQEIEARLNGLRASSEPAEVVRDKLERLAEVPFGPGRNLSLNAFRKRTGQGPVESPEAYVERVRKLVRNTLGNLTQLLLFRPEDGILQTFLEQLRELDPEADYRELRGRMERIGKSPQLWHYNERKKEFLLEWLRPYQEALGRPVAEMDPGELQAALKQVEQLRERRLEEMTHLVQEKERGPFRRYNRTLHPVMNGRNKDFWGGTAVRDEFIRLMGRIIARFSFNLEDRFLLFRSSDGGFLYLVGFADESLAEPMRLEGGGLALAPHLKVFLRNADGRHQEITQDSYGGDGAAYFRALRTAVVPFLTGISVMVEHEVSPQLKEAFDMWT